MPVFSCSREIPLRIKGIVIINQYQFPVLLFFFGGGEEESIGGDMPDGGAGVGKIT